MALSRRLPLALQTRNTARLSLVRSLHSSQKSAATTVDTSKAPSPNDAFATSTNSYYAEEMYKLYKQARRSLLLGLCAVVTRSGCIIVI